jgi:hypothetical protein
VVLRQMTSSLLTVDQRVDFTVISVTEQNSAFDAFAEE